MDATSNIDANDLPPTPSAVEPAEPIGDSTQAPEEAVPPRREAASPEQERKRIEEQILTLRRREAVLRRELAITDHPELADAIRLLEGKAFAVTRVEERMAQGLSKSEERRLGTLEKKLAGLYEKRAELEAQIQELEAETRSLGADRTRAFEVEREEALRELVAILGRHGPELSRASLEATALVPEIARWLPELESLAQAMVARTTA
jgi:chromosome segregation ATPase